jgi:hypothetical protein
MPAAWKERFVSSGESFSNLTRNQVVRFFRATRKQRANEEEQRQNKRTKDAKTKTKGCTVTQRNEKKRKVTSSKDSDPCPMYPNASHTRGECRGLKRNHNNKLNSAGRPSEKSKLKEANIYPAVVADPVEPTAPEGTSTCFTVETIVQFDDYLTSNNTSSLIQPDLPAHESVLDSFHMEIESCLAVGENSTEIASTRTLIKTNNMLPIGIMTVATFQGRPFRRPLKVLFDSGSSRTLIHNRINPESLPTN